MNSLFLIDVAELQSTATIVVHAQAPETSEAPALGISLAWVAVAALTSLIVLSIAFWKHWSLANYLGWMVVITLCVGTISAAIAFVTYRYWRDHQRVAEQFSAPVTSHPDPGRMVRPVRGISANTDPVDAVDMENLTELDRACGVPVADGVYVDPEYM